MINKPLFSSVFFDDFSTLLLCKTKGGVYTYVSNNSAKLSGYKNAEDLIGKTDYDLKCDAQKYANTFREQDQEAFDLGGLQTIDIMNYRDNCTKILLTTRKIVQDHNGQMHLCGTAIELPSTILNEFYRNNYVLEKIGSYKIINEIKKEDCQLSPRETQCIFLLLRGKSAKEMGHLLNVSPRTIEDYIERVKVKLKCSKKSEIFEKASFLGLYYYVPNSLLSYL